MKRRLALLSLIAGLCLLGLGLAWDRIMPSSAYWGPEQEKEFTAAQVDAHAKSHNRGDDEARERESAAARKRYERMIQQLKAARGSHRRGGFFLTAGGVALLLLGIALHLSAKGE